MRSILVLAVALILAQANGDLSQLKRRELDALVLTRLPITLQQANERIVGGSEAERNSIPYQVALLLTRSDGTFFCGGSLISRKFVLTAAHCVEDVTSAQVILGAHRFNENEDGQVRLQATKFHIHSGWNSLILINDIATIELDEEVELTDKIQLVKLPSRSDASNTFANEAGRVSGWGKDSDQASAVSPVLREVDVNIITKLFCNIRYLGVIQDSHVCSSGIGGIGSCSGDSGGPLVVGDTQVGVVSFGLGLGCEIGWPSVYSRVTYFLDWIAANSDVVIA
ncbi:chymotrypsin-related [Holotrichia oblita]|uniref:Chymotrypsin-related n=1 Tax=Holotrichia oblita TaxID=644536 RepID=A0ACB9TIL4_HOLOL|nr:chymotrypsin-related [Holotrichia oblita]